MGRLLPDISPSLAAFIAQQHVWFVATAPLSPEGRVNVSPRAGTGSIAVLNSRTVAWADLSGSGSETIGHALENGRITLLFVALIEGPPMIARLHGTARCILPSEAAPPLVAAFPATLTSSPGLRAFIWVDVARVTTSCGYSMPVFGPPLRVRPTLDEYAAAKGPAGMDAYRRLKNSFTIDRLPSVGLLLDAAAGGADDVRAEVVGGYWFRAAEAASSVAAGSDGVCGGSAAGVDAQADVAALLARRPLAPAASVGPPAADETRAAFLAAAAEAADAAPRVGPRAEPGPAGVSYRRWTLSAATAVASGAALLAAGVALGLLLAEGLAVRGLRRR